MTDETCIYPGCERPAFCDLEEHNALTAHQERRRLETKPDQEETTSG